jgi:hypothetical protein
VLLQAVYHLVSSRKACGTSSLVFSCSTLCASINSFRSCKMKELIYPRLIEREYLASQ